MQAVTQRIALITGGEGDLARAIQEELVSQNWQVHAPGKKILDVTDPASARAFVEKLPRLDYLIHAAGTLQDMPISRMQESDWDRILDTNLKGVFLVAQVAHELHMERQKSGHVLMIGSNSARFGTAGQANYAAAKAGLIGLMQSLAAEYGTSNVRVNAILPGFIRTKLTAHLSRGAEDHVLKRLNTPGEVARFIAFLDTMPHTSGQVFQLDSRVGREL